MSGIATGLVGFEGVQDSSSITSWLSDHPDPARYIPINEDKGRKRLHTQSSRGGKRCKLSEMSHNAAHSDLPDAKKAAPKRQTRRAKAPVEAKPPSSPTGQDRKLVDEEQTPKPKAVDTASRRNQLLGSLPPPLARPASQSSPSAASSRDSRSRTTRSGSPTKRLGDFQLSDMRVQMVGIGTPGYPLPSAVKGLYRDMMAIGNGRAVIPAAVRDQALTKSEEIFDDFNFRPFSGKEIEQQATRCSLSHNDLWTRAEEILEAGLDCKNKSMAEASWNSEVHSRLLHLALRGWWQSKSIWYRDITAARTHDVTLLPRVAGGVPMQSKMVDYALILETWSPDLHEGVIKTLRSEGKPSINHTGMESVRFSPIAVSIETKRGTIEEDTANVQLATWVSAHFARLRQLLNARKDVEDEHDLPVLPLVMVQGHQWRLMFAHSRMGAQEEQKILIFGPLLLGCTDMMLGIYKIVEAVRRLAQWVDKDYKPWFEKEVLGFV